MDKTSHIENSSPENEIVRLQPYLSQEEYLLAKQRAGRNGMNISGYIAYVISNHSMSRYVIKTHDLTAMAGDIEEVVYRASGYYRTTVTAGEIDSDTGEKIIRMHEKLMDMLEKRYLELQERREQEIKATEAEIRLVMNKAGSNLKRDKTIASARGGRHKINCLVSEDIYERMMANMACIGCTEVTKYIVDMITAKYFLTIDYMTSDLLSMNSLIYSGTRYSDTFLKMFDLQGFENAEQGIKVKVCLDRIHVLQKEIWHDVVNDRKRIYRKYMRKVRDNLCLPV